MSQRVGTKGQVVIPKALRDEIGLQPGAEVEFERDGAAVRIRPSGPETARALRGRFAGSAMAKALLDDRVHEPR